MQFFPLPVPSTQGLWGERLFSRFDHKGVGSIGFEEFASGLSLCIKSSREDKLKLLFSLYDLKNDGLIDKDEFLTMIHNTYQYTIHKGQYSQVNIEPPEEIKETTTRQSFLKPRKSIERPACIHREESRLPVNIEQFVKTIMQELQAADKIDYQQFVRFVDQHPRIMEVFNSAFHQDIWATRTLERSAVHKKASRSLCLSCNCLRSSPRVSVMTESKVISDPSILTLAESKTGWLTQKFRNEESKKVFAILRSNTLLLYISPSAPFPCSVVFLEGCFIDPVVEFSQGNTHGLSIAHVYEGFKPLSFWTNTKQERDQWLLRLQAAARSRKIDEFYEIKERIGSGKFSDVYATLERLSDLKWAVKVIDKKRLNNDEKEMLRSEIAIMKLLNHPSVVEMKEFFEDKHKMYVVMEFIEGGELYDCIRKRRVFSEYMAFHITKQLLETVKYLHEVGIVHRDIKPENILLSDNSELPVIKLADFGLSKLIGPNDVLEVACGTLGYVAPEVLARRPYGKKVDLWSIGVVCYLMLRGRLPFDSKDKQTLIDRTIRANLDLTGQYWSRVTNFGKDFISKLLVAEPGERMDCEAALNHSWIKNGEVVIPRKINREAVAQEMMRNTMTNSQIAPALYDEKPMKTPQTGFDDRIIYSTPDIYEDMEIERKIADLRIFPG